MKKLLTLILAGITCYGCQKDIIEETQEISPATRATIGSTEYYYWCDGVKIPLTINENKLFVLTETAKFEKANRSIVPVGSRIESSRTTKGYASSPIDLSGKNAKAQTSFTSFILDHANLKAINSESVVYVAPYFKARNGADIGITNVFSVRLEDEVKDIAKLEKLAEVYNLILLGKNPFDQSIYYLSCTKDSKGNALEMANRFYESGAFEYATPVFIIEANPDTNDTHFDSQWNLYNGANPSFDINYTEAMNAFSFPNIGNIVVAVVDSGVDANHEDLPLHTVSYNAHTGNPDQNFYPPQTLYGPHGTACAGIIGATANNGKGIAGIASGVKIMPISVLFDSDASGTGAQYSTSDFYANAIRFAANHGADVISNSWHYHPTDPQPDINEAIRYAQGSSGRGGKGCVVVFSAGNGGGPVYQPAAGVPETLVVGAINKRGSRMSVSNFGPELDIVAPGEDIYTTDISGNDGYSNGTTWPHNYYPFDNTSAAAPQVAGVAALVLSVNPYLTQKQVVDIIEQTAQELDYYPDMNKPNGPWNRVVGYGLVDAYAAVMASMPVTSPAISANMAGSVAEWTNVHFSVSNPQSGVTYEWESNGTIVQGATGSSVSIQAPRVAGGSGIDHTGSLSVKCRARIGGSTSTWSNTVWISVYRSHQIVNANDKRISGRDSAPFYPNDNEWSYNFGYNLEVVPYNSSYTYIWDAEFDGPNYVDWRLWNKSNYQNTYFESIEACILSGHPGGNFWITCRVYDGNTLISDPRFLLGVYPAPGYFRKLSPDSLTNVRQSGMPVPIR